MHVRIAGRSTQTKIIDLEIIASLSRKRLS